MQSPGAVGSPGVSASPLPTELGDAPGRALVLACGNTLRGDDGVGWRIGSVLDEHPTRVGVEVIPIMQLLPEHAALVSAVDIVVFIDCTAQTPPGTVSTIAIHPAETMPRIFTHHLDPASLLKLAQDLYGRIPSRAVAVTVGGETFELNEGLSVKVEAAIPVALKAVRRALRKNTLKTL